ncbi:MAG TPA: DUF1549 domain-containing protein [Lacipirellulaceae bacterium]|jgi:hypothetical protein|nr:DUF1549 domain-containing protein [Lacipirellulaceae bacterium]
MMLPPAKVFGQFALVLLAATIGPSLAMAKPSAEETAREVDRLLADEVFKPETKLAPRIDDATYLRRVWLDIVGDIPTPEHVTAFLLDSAKDKRQRVVDELLASPQYGQNWARYWRDVVLSRKLEDRASIVANPLVVTLTDKFNENESWAKVATEFITATGDVRANGETAIELAQDGRTEETTAEMSRIFLGIQIQCAQCHDHKTDRWKREQFHEFAAFFPRIAVRPIQSPVERSFEVVSDDRPDFGRKAPADVQNRRGKPEHYMPNLSDPAAEGTKMQPKFFLTSAKLPFGTPDAERRGTVAKWMTQNKWFAIAFVNRMWGELVGEGFYEPIDDMGPDRKPSAPKTVELLSHGFAENGFDVKWLFRTICATEAYQRESRPRREVSGTPFVASVAQPLRSDQLFNALLSVVDTPEPEAALSKRERPADAAKPKYGLNATVRQSFEVAFGYDPSDPRETVNASIPQALAMMNGVRINLAVRAIGQETMLGKLLASTNDNNAVIEELYLRTLSREPTDQEHETALKYCKETKNRAAVFEDLLWALVNSSEFSHRR